MNTRLGGRRPLAAALVLIALTTMVGCSAGDRHKTSTPTPSTSRSTADAAAVHRLTRAIAITSALHSYSFSSTQTLGGTKPVRTTLVGVAVRPSSLSYILTAGGRRTQVIRLRGATYLRVLPGHWSRLKRPVPTVDPGASLISLMKSLTNPTASAGRRGATILHATLPGSAVTTAGLPEGTGETAVTVTLNAAGQVIGLTVVGAAGRAHGVPVKVELVISYGSFNRVQAPSKPV